MMIVEVNEDVNEDNRKDMYVYQIHSDYKKKYYVRSIPLAQQVNALFCNIEMFLMSIKQEEFDEIQAMYRYLENQLLEKSGIVKFIDKPRDAQFPYEVVILNEEVSKSGIKRVVSGDVAKVIEILDNFFNSDFLEIVVDKISTIGCCGKKKNI